jgi:hypothetical protein
MKKSTTVVLLVLTVCLGAWMLWRGDGGPRNVNGHLLFDWSDRLEERIEKGELGVDVDPAQVAGIDLKISSGEFSLRRQPDGGWDVSGAVKDRADEGIVKELLNYCTKAQIKDIVDIAEVKDGKTSEASLGLDDSNAWRVTWLKADGSKLVTVRIGKTAPLENVAYVRMEAQERRPDIYIVSPDLRPLLARPPESFRDPRVSRYPAEALLKMIVRKGEGEVEFSRTFVPAAPAPAKPPVKPLSTGGRNIVEVEPTPWVISRPLPNAPADQPSVNDFAAMICGARVEAWVPFNDTANGGEKPVVEITLVPAGASAKGITLAFYKDPADPSPASPAVKPAAPGTTEDIEEPEDPRSMAICRDVQRKASFKVKRRVMDDLCIAESPNIFRSRILASVNPAIISTIRIQRTEGDSVEVVRVRDKWSWRPLGGTKFEDAAPETVERLVTLLNSTQIIDFASDSLSDPATYGLDKPVLSITIAAGAHISLDKLNPVDARNSQTLRIGLAEPAGKPRADAEGLRIYANFSRDPFVFRIGPELEGGIPRSFVKWRSLTLPGFSLLQLHRIKQTISTDPPLEMEYDARSFKWTAKRGGADVTSQLNSAAAEALALKAGSLQAVAWQENGGAAQTALDIPAVRIDVEYEVWDDNPAGSHLASSTLEFAPMSSPTAIYCFGQFGGKAQPFLIQREVLNEMAAPLLRK